MVPENKEQLIHSLYDLKYLIFQSEHADRTLDRYKREQRKYQNTLEKGIAPEPFNESSFKKVPKDYIKDYRPEPIFKQLYLGNIEKLDALKQDMENARKKLEVGRFLYKMKERQTSAIMITLASFVLGALLAGIGIPVFIGTAFWYFGFACIGFIVWQRSIVTKYLADNKMRDQDEFFKNVSKIENEFFKKTDEYNKLAQKIDAVAKKQSDIFNEFAHKRDKYIASAKEYVEEYKKAYKHYQDDKALFDSNKAEAKAKHIESDKKRIAEETENLKILIKKLDDEIAKNESEIDNLSERMGEYDFVSESCYQYVERMINILEMGRADDYQTALNIAVSDQRAEEQNAEMQRIAQQKADAEAEHNRHMQQIALAEQQRQAEHNRQMENIAAQQAREQERHNREMQQKQAEFNRQAEQARRIEESKARDAERKANHAGSMQCGSCANRGKCNVVWNNKGNCAAYRPR